MRAYTERMGLFRAAILGAKGTPYHDNLFFFDIYLPPDYPNVPPDVRLHPLPTCSFLNYPNMPRERGAVNVGSHGGS